MILFSNIFYMCTRHRNNVSNNNNTGRIQIDIRTRCQTNVDDSMTINIVLTFSLYFTVINVSVNNQ